MGVHAKVLITGASGLLGTAIVEKLSTVCQAIPLCHRQVFPGMIETDLLDAAAVRRLDRLEWDAVVNCAAYRSPDVCERERERAHRLNVRMPHELARLAAARGAAMVHVSTDYVFPGVSPPYAEDDAPAPVNYYGQTKAEAEACVREAHPAAVVMRIPALYGNPPPPLVSTLVQEGIDAVLGGEPRELDNVTVRRPTLTDDVAVAVAALLEVGFSGTIHVSAGEATTRYEWARAVARLLGRDAGHLRPGPTGVGSVARRPVDSHLSTRRLAGLGIAVPRDFSEVLPSLLRARGCALAADAAR